MQSYGPFNYLVSVTGDCSHTSAGAINIYVSGGTPPYTVEWYNHHYHLQMLQLEHQSELIWLTVHIP